MAFALCNKPLSLLKRDLQFYAYIEKSNLFNIHTLCYVTPSTEVHFSSYSFSLTPKIKNKLTFLTTFLSSILMWNTDIVKSPF